MHRRRFIATAAIATTATGVRILRGADDTPTAPARRLTLSLAPGSIGVQASQIQAIDLAHRHGFESVEPYTDTLASLSTEQLTELLGQLKAKNLGWGTAGLPLEFRQDDQRFADGLGKLPKVAAALQRAGVTRVGTWLSPGHSMLTYIQNFKQHATRLREGARVLKDNGLRLGLEYVGTKTSRDNVRYPFIHSLAELQELIAEIGTGNVGVILDSWHWWQAGDSAAALEALRNQEVVSVDLNDAPAGIAKELQRDNQRELPAATGVLPVAPFVTALTKIGYDGPVRAEPFNKALNDLDNDAACAATIAALKRALAG